MLIRFNTLLALGFWGASVSYWMRTPALQEAVAAWEWFLLPTLALAVVIFARVSAALVTRRPGLLNVPDKARFLALPPARQAPVLRRMRRLLGWLTVEILLVAGLLQAGEAVTPGSDHLNGFHIAALAFGLAGSPLVALSFVAGIQNEIGRQVRAHRTELAPDTRSRHQTTDVRERRLRGERLGRAHERGAGDAS